MTPTNAVFRNVEKKGARYVWNVTSGIKNKTVTFVGRSNQHVTATWAGVGK